MDPKKYEHVLMQDLNLSTRAFNCSIRYYDPPLSPDDRPPFAVSHVLSFTYKELMNIKNLGAEAANEIIEKIKEYGKTH